MAEANKRYAVVTGANKGIGLEICKQLASNGIVVVLTSRDEQRGLEAVEKLKQCGLSHHLLFHQLDVADSTSVASLAHFVKTQFGKLDILVNNAGVIGVITNGDALRAWGFNLETPREKVNEIMTQTPELSEECLNINYYGTKRMIGALLPLLQLSAQPIIVNVSSGLGKLELVRNEWAIRILSDARSLTEEKVDEVLNEYLKDFKEGSIDVKNWPVFFSAYTLSKAAMNAYTRILAKKHPSFCINCVCPGDVRTDINSHIGSLSAEEGAERVVRLALLPNGGPSGYFFMRNQETPF